MDYTFVSKYARWIPEKKRRETWNEAVDRVKQMMLEKYADKPEVLPEIEWAYEQMRKKKFLVVNALYNLAARQSLNTMPACIIVLSHFATELDSFKSVCIYFFVVVAQALVYKSTT